MTKLVLDWASPEASKHACKWWHYTGKMPAGARISIGVWEDDRFIGVVVFGSGSGNATNGSAYGLRKHHDMAELCRVALRDHKSPVSRIVSIAVRMLKKKCPGLKLLMSMADPAEGHHGGIYQAMNWIYTGEGGQHEEFYYKGKWRHSRSINEVKGLAQSLRAAGLSREPSMKYRYLLPLDDKLRPKIEALRKPYPKRQKQAMAGHPPAQREGSTHPDAPNHDVP